MRVRVVRRGGIAGVALETTVDTSELPDSDGEAAESALRDLPWDGPPIPPRHPDQFRYELSADGRTATLTEDDLPPPLRPLLDLLSQRGTILR